MRIALVFLFSHCFGYIVECIEGSLVLQRDTCMRCKKLLVALLCGWCGSLAAATGPCSKPAYRAFDFRVGQWDVRIPDGRTAGTNHIVRAQQGCLLVENWQGVKGSSGTSMNFTDPLAGQWQQIWVSPGVIIDIRGGLDDGTMVLESSITYTANNDQFPFKGSWTLLDDGRVRQFFEESRVPGEWKTWFEGFYTEVSGANAEARVEDAALDNPASF